MDEEAGKQGGDDPVAINISNHVFQNAIPRRLRAVWRSQHSLLGFIQSVS